MPLITAELNYLADQGAARGSWISLHTATPGTTGANEATGGTPAYARKQTTWGAAASGSAVGSQVTFDVPAGTYTHFGVWSAATAGTFRGGNALSANQGNASAQSQVQVTPTYGPVTAS